MVEELEKSLSSGVVVVQYEVGTVGMCLVELLLHHPKRKEHENSCDLVMPQVLAGTTQLLRYSSRLRPMTTNTRKLAFSQPSLHCVSTLRILLPL